MPIKLLFLAANPIDTVRLNLDDECRAIEDALRKAEFRSQFVIEKYAALRVADLQELLLRYQPDVVHFSGHGSPASEIILKDGEGNHRPVPTAAFEQLFAVLKDNIRCVVLNACYSEAQARAIAAHIDCVVGMSDAISDAAATGFATAFYQALGYGRTLRTAFDLGCLALHLENLDEQNVPRLIALRGDPSTMILTGQAQPEALPDSNCARPAPDRLRLYYPTQTDITPAANPGGRKRIFLSYKRGAEPDEALALQLHQALSQDHDVFIDQIMPVGTAWGERIQRELEACDFLLPLLSNSSAHSEMVESEISTAYQLGRNRNGRPGILPVRVAYTAPFDYPLSAYLNPLNWAMWRSAADTPTLIAELRTAIAGGQLSLSDRQDKLALLQAPAPSDLPPRPTASADITRIERPDGTMDAGSRFYIERPGDAACQRELARGGATIVIKAPRQMGKSSLLVRAAAQASRMGRAVAFLDFQLLDADCLNDPRHFFQNFCRWIADELDLDDRVDEAWKGGLGHTHACTKYLQRQVLKTLTCPLTLVIDEVDRMLGCKFSSDFFGMLRNWHNSRATSSEWRKLDLLLVISTEPYLLIDDLKQSPFNVGEVIRLEDFSLAQTAALNDRHASPFDPPQVQRLHALLGGQPYLTRQALYRVALGDYAAETLLSQAGSENGPFGDHLRRHLSRFSERPELARAILNVIRQQRCPDELLYNRLLGAGLVQPRQGECVLPRCELYAAYFREHLQNG